MIYNHKPSQYFHPYVLTPSTPLYPFGFGLSYTKYEYSDLKLSTTEIKSGQPVEVELDVRNSGSMDGVEIVQLYIRDRFSTFTRPVKELKDFARVKIKAGETKRVKFTVTPDKLMMLDKDNNPVIEPGEFVIMVGPSSKDEDLLKKSFNVIE
ncbi:hypothetical protein SDC9_172260 [bioreactor metagenome]|uniref:Fibronectin type III-like domain-containing protein n=1 Tax=bioreactor metagenome TaxID=1076179 RepID=A0A645GDV4_9ZZZZ